jgi:TrpR-related protein YerC/YecD
VFLVDKLHNESTDLLFESILTLKTVDECYALFEDICTIKEIQSIAQRVVVAKMLTEGKVYNDIVAETGASTATISRVNRSLNYGSDGYKIAFERLKEKNEL